MRPLEFLTEHFERALALVFLGGFALFVASAFTGTGGDLIGGDAAEYFEYARSLLVNRHLPQEHIKYPCGVALIGVVGYAPIMLGAKALSLGSRWATGWALPLQIAYCVPLVGLSWIAFRANAAMYIRLGFAEHAVKPMILFWILATNVGFYVLKEPAMSEGATYAVVSLYYWSLLRWFYESPAERSRPPDPVPTRALLFRAGSVGLLLGLAGMIRQQNILHGLAVPLLVLSPAGKRLEWDRRFKTVALVALASLPLFLLPWVVWYAAEGKLVLYSYGNEGFNFLSPRPLLLLFHPGYHGLFTFHPAYAVAAVGLIPFARHHRDVGRIWIAAILIQGYLAASWWMISFGASVGHRGFFPVAPLLLGGWIAAGNWAIKTARHRALLTIAVLLTIGNAVVTLLVMTNRINPLGIQP